VAVQYVPKVQAPKTGGLTFNPQVNIPRGTTVTVPQGSLGLSKGVLQTSGSVSGSVSKSSQLYGSVSSSWSDTVQLGGTDTVWPEPKIEVPKIPKFPIPPIVPFAGGGGPEGFGGGRRGKRARLRFNPLAGVGDILKGWNRGSTQPNSKKRKRRKHK
jgi:hypothetical protein